MNIWLFAAFMGLLQGITEFLPVSSSGHLALFQNIFGMESVEDTHMLFSVMLHFGTLISVLIMYRKDIFDMIKAFVGFFRRGGSERGNGSSIGAARLIVMIVIATVPLTAIALLADYIGQLNAKTGFVGLMLVLTGGLLYVSDKVPKGGKNEKTAKYSDSIVIGLMQAAATLPGISRSGATITGGLIRGFDRSFAVKFSFILSIPAVVGAVVLESSNAIKAGVDPALIVPYIFGTALAAAAGCFAIRLVRFISEKDRFRGFAYYCWGVGVLAIILSFFSR